MATPDSTAVRAAHRPPKVASRLRVFEVDQPGPQSWKRQRLIDLGFGVTEQFPRSIVQEAQTNCKKIPQSISYQSCRGMIVIDLPSSLLQMPTYILIDDPKVPGSSGKSCSYFPICE